MTDMPIAVHWGDMLCVNEESLSASPGSSLSSSVAKKRIVQKKKKRWKIEYSTTVWLNFDVLDREHLVVLKYSICSQFSEKLECMSHFRPAFINGSTNIRISNV